MATAPESISIIAALRDRFGSQIVISDDCQIAADVLIEISPLGLLILGNRVSIRRGTTIQVLKKARVVIKDDVKVGEHSYISAMTYIHIGRGCGISNMVDIHDHNHRDRSFEFLTGNAFDPDESGFEAAPVYIESAVTLSNKVTVTAGVRIGQNAKVGANSVVSRSIPHNVVAVGTPAKPIKYFEGPLNVIDPRKTRKVAFFGTSIVQHLQAFNGQIFDQMNLPEVGESVTIERWVERGFVHRVDLTLQILHPEITFHIGNYGRGGATSPKVLERVTAVVESSPENFDVVFFGCGINDVWRKYQGREDEAIDAETFEKYYRQALSVLVARANEVVCISETPVDIPEALLMNAELEVYNAVAKRCAEEFKVYFLDVWGPFMKASRELSGWKAEPNARISLWSDGVHLNDYGDALMAQCITEFLSNTKLIEKSHTLPRLERYEALDRYLEEHSTD